ncbi:hypothetical protein Aperf_G00000131410 [Anoplocephala perfoliata]
MDAKKRRKLKKGDIADDVMQPSPFELEVCKYMYRNLATKEGRLAGCHVSYFKANDAIDLLLKSKWACSSQKENNSRSICFSSPEIAVRFMEKLVEKRLIGRAMKIKRKAAVRRKDDKKSKGKASDPKELAKKGLNNEAQASLENSSVATPAAKGSSKASSDGSSFMSVFSSYPVSKSKKPVRLEYATDQMFIVDSKPSENGVEDVYVWIYEAPPSLTTWLLGFALIAFIIVCCAYPMWPSQARQGAYYLTILALSFLGFLIFVAFVRLVFYIFILLLSLGRLRVWIFPNLFADCGFLESFRPFYSLEKIIPPTPSTDAQPVASNEAN